jgi:hypothetical protein
VKFKYFRATPIQNCVDGCIKRRLNSGSAYYHSIQNVLSSSLIPKNLNINICGTIVMPVVLCGCETWSVILREEHRLRLFQNRVLKMIVGCKWGGKKVPEGMKKLYSQELHDWFTSPVFTWVKF